MNPVERDAVLTVRNLSHTFRGENGGLHVLDGINFQVCPQDFCCVLGPSGSGKSTLLRVLAGLLRPSGGQVDFCGSAEKPRIGLVFQQANLMPWRSALHNVRLPLEVVDYPKADRDARCIELLRSVGLERFVDAYPDELSGGMKQRVAIVRALSWNPSILLMDEPFGALDAMTRERLQDELLDIWQRTKLTVVFVTHSVEEAIVLANRVVVMTPGPGRIESDNSLGLPRPRDVSSPEFNDIRRVLGAKLHSHHAKKAA